MEGFSLRDWAHIHFLDVPHTSVAGFKFPHVHQTRHYPWVCRSRLDGFRFGADISGYRTITGAALVGTSSRSGCTGASEAPSAYLPFSRNAGAGGETDSAMRRCVPRPNAISPTRCHVPCCALRAAAICDGRAKGGICGRARKFQLLGAIACDLVHSKLHNMCRLQQSPAVAVELPRHFFQPGGVHPSQKALSKVTESGGPAWKWICVFHR